MATFDKRNTFIFGKNDRKEKDTHPDLTGSFVDANGVEHWFSAWRKEKDGRTFYTGSVKPKEGSKSGGGNAYSSKPLAETIDDGIPF